MKDIIKAFSLFAILALAPAAGWAAWERAPEEIEKDSDIIGTVRVLAATCVEAVPAKEIKEYRFQAWLQVVKLVKGSVKAGETVLVGWSEWSEPLVGNVPDPFLPGEEIQARLKWNDAGRIYEETPGGGRAKRLKPSKYKTLKRKPGTIFLPK
ncbi:MAG: hypothetical protein HY611_02190 [Elusimicrobia bacterium]|nr:hypothetical protein [Elusimicrobiota bacterium]